MVTPTTRLGAGEEGDPAGRPAARSAAEQDVPSSRRRQRPETGPALPARAAEDTDESWGELPQRSDDARYLNEKPPHWQ